MSQTDKRSDFWHKKRVFITGHTGFKGGWLSLWLQSMGAEVFGYSLEPSTQPNFFELCQLSSKMHSEIGDIRDYDNLTQQMKKFQPQIIFHLAAQPLVLRSYEAPIETYETNVLGTLNVLEAARKNTSAKVFVNITSDKCYENKEWIWSYRESEALGGHDPYSSSKACAEILANSYRQSFCSTADSMALISVRAGNCIGGGDWSSNRLIPDLMQAIHEDRVAAIRHPKAIRPWQHVLEPLDGYLLLAEKAWENPKNYNEAWNFGPNLEDSKPVQWIVECLSSLSSGRLQYQYAENVNALHEAYTLRVDSTKARALLGWQSKLELGTALEWIYAWYSHFWKNKNMREFSLQQIDQYSQKKQVCKAL